jgi:hypothetical protein
VVVDLGEAKILVGEVPQFVDGGVDGQAALGDGVEQVAQAVLFDGGPPKSST